MSVKTSSERLLMTVPKPVYDWLANAAEKDGVTVQDKIRELLEQNYAIFRELIKIFGKSTETVEEFGAKLEEECYQLGKKVYDEFATERNRLTVIQPEHDSYLEEYGLPDDFVLPVIQKNFLPLENNELNRYVIAKAAKQVADVENKLLSICNDGDKVFEALPFGGSVRTKDGNWRGWFRICLNSEKTPSWADAIRVTS